MAYPQPPLLTARIPLGDASVGRDNNFNLIRFLAAFAVLVSHAWPISLGPGTPEPFVAISGYSLGQLAVFVFFALSGFFIAGSYVRLQSAPDFVIARAARLLPGLAVSLVVVALVIGPIASELPLREYLAHPETLTFLLRNLTLIQPQYSLPGVFTTLPYPMVEGSIWTLVHEVICYAMVLLSGFSGVLMRRRALFFAMMIYAVLWGLPQFTSLDLHPRIEQTRMLSLPFVTGVVFWVWRDRIVLYGPCAALLVVTAVAANGTDFAFPMLALALTYAVFWLGHMPGPTIRRFNALGDYSYGVYIYAFPVQGLMVWLWGVQSPLLNVALSVPLTLGCAVLSWHLIERPALDWARTSPRRGKHLSRQW